MKYGFFLLSPQIDRDRSAATVLADTIAMAEEAEGLGFDHLWVAEHHFANLSLSPSPLITLSHLAARTQRIRLGTGVLVLPLQDPMRLAEEIAYVDIVSGGRLDYGVGRGSIRAHFDGFGIPHTLVLDPAYKVFKVYRGAVTREMLEEDLQAIAQRT